MCTCVCVPAKKSSNSFVLRIITYSNRMISMLCFQCEARQKGIHFSCKILSSINRNHNAFLQICALVVDFLFSCKHYYLFGWYSWCVRVCSCVCVVMEILWRGKLTVWFGNFRLFNVTICNIVPVILFTFLDIVQF